MLNAVIQDFTWGKEDNTLFISASSGTLSLEAIIAWLPGPLNDGTEVDTAQQTRQTLFTTGYPSDNTQLTPYTISASIETLSYAHINGEGFISGLSTCSPGFSLPVSELTSATTRLFCCITMTALGCIYLPFPLFQIIWNASEHAILMAAAMRSMAAAMRSRIKAAPYGIGKLITVDEQGTTLEVISM